MPLRSRRSSVTAARGTASRSFARRRTHRVDTGTGVPLEVREDCLGRRERRITVGGRAHRVIPLPRGSITLAEVDAFPHRVSRDSAGTVRAQSPAVVLRIPVRG